MVELVVERKTRDSGKASFEIETVVSDEMPLAERVVEAFAFGLDRDSRLVLISGPGETWQLPGGSKGKRETAIERAVRGVREGTGAELVSPLAFAFRRTKPIRGTKVDESYAVLYLGAVDPAKVGPEATFFTADEVDPAWLGEETPDVLHAALHTWRALLD
ncbi:NUDIX domain-containing protein [Kribbella deserti]|uniref:NUDIX domain-containing protein n=1 Tax=Kribbella deserti TaxID=1926257 RepID=A0ABV6QNR9_9ACTN